jgi:hypothetical protein
LTDEAQPVGESPEGQKTPVLEKHIFPHTQAGIGVETDQLAFMFLNANGAAYIFPADEGALLNLGVGALMAVSNTTIANLPEDVRQELSKKFTGGIILPGGARG